MKTKKRSRAKRATKRPARAITPALQPASRKSQTAETLRASAENDEQNEQDDEAQLDWAEEIFLRDWFRVNRFDEEDEQSERAREIVLKYLTEKVGIWWPPFNDRWDEDDVLAENLFRERFQAFQILDIGGGGMIWGGLTFYLVHLDFLNRQALYYFESFNDIVGPAIPLPVFCTSEDINSNIYDILANATTRIQRHGPMAPAISFRTRHSRPGETRSAANVMRRRAD